ncbi:ABC transporter substrate-binding protein [Cohnella herbarum]|uniref:Sugar ABC transporter substrate-binding protein n=1 Tax=Cohnella herbarum TaxID=2728023 RepID=A0A7Z2VJH8_9BACL|nr:sugar ABC transporter substrate-binding protein [Cohnella herbarum]QJD84242.1 sugar ABC transporter substrate-binding protein [Cohnella herbarum]
MPNKRQCGRSLRSLASLVALGLLLVIAAACGGKTADIDPTLETLLGRQAAKDPPSDRIVLRIWSFHQSEEFGFWQWLGEEYAKVNPNVEVKVEYISSDDYFSGNRMPSSFASGHGPDIFFVSAGTIRKYVNSGILQALDEHFTEDMRNDFFKSALDSVTVDGRIYAIPFETELLGLYYNEKLFREKGISPPATWEQMREAASRLGTGKRSGLTVETFGGVYQSFSWLPFLWQAGADLVAEEGGASGLTAPGARTMYGFFRDMAKDGLLNLHPSRPTTDIGILASGETAMQVSGSWNIRTLEANYSDQEIGVVPLPVPPGGKELTAAGGWKIGVNHFGSNADEAAKFILWAFAEREDIPLKWCTEVKFAYPSRESVMSAGEQQYDRGLRSVFTSRIFGTERQEPQLPEELTRIFTDSLNKLLFGEASVDTLLADTNARLSAYFANVQK